jgi:general secretion pathway protein K
MMMSMLSRGQRSKVRGQKEQSAGAAIMLALWALFLLSAMIISWALDINSRLTLSGNGTRMLKAEAAACSGAEIALHPLINPGSQSLVGIVGDGATYEARMTGEGGRLDINWLVAGEDPDKLEILKRYLENKGIDLNERDAMVDALLDWVEPNTGLHHLNAPPESENYHPPHAGGLARVDELKQIAGWADFTSQPGWDDDFTVITRSGIDLQWASRDVLLALPGMDDRRVDAFLETRRGPDGIDGTQDDKTFKGDEALVVLGFNQKQMEQVRKFLMPTRFFRITSVGRAGNATRTVQMVFMKGTVTAGGSPQVLGWKEF